MKDLMGNHKTKRAQVGEDIEKSSHVESTPESKLESAEEVEDFE
jgi:hypothetical protein